MTVSDRVGPADIACDVLVIGGGTAGVAAAAAAGRAGARVVLLERYGFLGGLATAAQVGTICGLYLRDAAAAKPEPVAGGFVEEFGSRLARASGTQPLRLEFGLWILPYSHLAFARLADQFVSESRNVKLVLHATVFGARAEGGRLEEVRALAWNEPLSITPRAVVDCTGEATAVALAGDATRDGASDQAPALVFALENVDPRFGEGGVLAMRLALRRAVQDGLLPPVSERIALVPRTYGDGRLFLKLNLGTARAHIPIWEQVSAWEREARQLAHQVVEFLVANVAAFREARLRSISPQLGVRSGRRISGRAELTEDDVLRGRKTALGIARGAWPMERWGPDLRPEMTFLNERDFYEIPVDCLRPMKLDNVLTAGRCLSATAGAMTSARIIGTALGTGWAAGRIAAEIAAGHDVGDATAAVRTTQETGR